MQAVLFPDDTSFWFETLRVLGATAYGGADIGEVLVTAQVIKPGDYDSWYDEWLATADRIATEAEKAYAARYQRKWSQRYDLWGHFHARRTRVWTRSS
jgi:hypothetical protein